MYELLKNGDITMLDLGELQNDFKRVKRDETGGNNNDFLNNFVPMPEGAGAVTIRLLAPAKSGTFGRAKNPFYQVTRIHRINNKSLHCPRVLNPQTDRWVGDCPLCGYYSHLWKESEKAGLSKDQMKELQSKARSFKPTERYYYNAIVRSVMNKETGVPEKNVGPKILSIGKQLHTIILTGILGDEKLEEKPLGDVTDPKTGRDFKIFKELVQSGNDTFPTYVKSKYLTEPSPLGTPDEVKKWMDGLHDLASLRIVKSNEELKDALKVYLGLIPDTNSSGNNFDASEFEPVAEKPKVHVVAKAVVPVEVAKVEVSETTDAVDGPMADEDFMRQLRGEE